MGLPASLSRYRYSPVQDIVSIATRLPGQKIGGKPRTAACGFTLVELLVVIGVAGILASMAVPGMRVFLQNQRGATAAGALVSSLSLARSEAIKEDAAAAGVTVCASTDGATCDPGGAWGGGWIVLPPAVIGVTPLQTVRALPSDLTLSVQPALARVSFLSSGQTALGAPYVSFKFCDSRGAAFARVVEVSLGGRIQAAPKVGQDIAGVALTCP